MTEDYPIWPAEEKVAGELFDAGSGAEEPDLWGLERIGIRDGDARGGEGSILYILDTGVRLHHDEFGARGEPGMSSGCRPVETTDSSACEEGFFASGIIDDESIKRCSHIAAHHGTSTASLAVGTEVGVARDARVVPVQVMNCRGEGFVSDF